MKNLPIIKENEKKDSSFVDFWAFEVDFAYEGDNSAHGTYCQYAPYVPRVR